MKLDDVDEVGRTAFDTCLLMHCGEIEFRQRTSLLRMFLTSLAWDKDSSNTDDIWNRINVFDKIV